MTVRPLRLLDDPVLRTPCDPVVRFDDALARLVTDLLDTVAEPGRAGLAANQIGSGLAVFSYNVEGQPGYVINPQVVELRGSIDGPEACLSIPGVSAIRTRAEYAVVEGVDKLFPVDVFIPGCPPRPEALIEGILKLEEKLTGKRRWPVVKPE